MEPLTTDDAEDLLANAALVPAMSGSIAEMKNLRDRCLQAGIPVLVGCPPGAGKGWGTKTHLLVEEDELPNLAALMRGDWREALAREGVDPVEAADDACPACGTAAPLVDGACSDCGLHLGG
jgi:hypothetical protein